jgi:hypothetical protein
MPFRYFLLLLAPGIGTASLVWGAKESRHSDRIREIIARGPAKKARVVFFTTKSSGGTSKGSKKTTTYWVDLEVDGRPLQREVLQEVWRSVEPGTETDWYEGPAMPEGFSALEIGRVTDGQAFPYFLAFFLVFVVRGIYRKALPKPAKVEAAEWPAPDPAPNRLPPPPREGRPAFRTPSFFPLAAATLGLSGALAGYFADLGTWGAALLQAAQGLGAVLALLGSAVRLRATETALWRDGVEVVGQCTSVWTRGTLTRYQATFAFGGQVWRLDHSVLRESPPLAEEGRPASVLVDPKNPKRATLMPSA